jgi:hypothetical protein
MRSSALSLAASHTYSCSNKTACPRTYMTARHDCCYMRYWLKRWARGCRDQSLRRLRERLASLSPAEACALVLECVRSDYDPEVTFITPLLIWEVYGWHKKAPNRTHRQVWYTLRRFVRRRLCHYHIKVREAGFKAAENAYCYTAADKRRLFLQNILHPQEDIWLTIVDWAQYVAWRDLISLLLQETPWRHGTAWNVLFVLDNWVIDRMDEVQKQELLDALKRVLLHVDRLCSTQDVDEMALWKICETIGFHIRGEAAKHMLREMTQQCQSVAVCQACWNAVEDYFGTDDHVC